MTIPQPDPDRRGRQSAPAPGNPFGLVEALIGFAAAELLASLALAAFGAASGHPRHPSSFGGDLSDLAGVWAGFFGAVVGASVLFHRRLGDVARRVGSVAAQLRGDYGLELRPWPDLPLGLAIGIGTQYLLVPVFEAPLWPFVPHLYQRLGGPAHQITGSAHGASLAVLGLFLCVGAPFVEECFFRGLLLRALLWRLGPLGARLGPAVAIVLTGLVFGLAHFEALQFLGLAGFGIVLGALAWRTGRLGPGIVAHLAFNAVTVISLALAR